MVVSAPRCVEQSGFGRREKLPFPWGDYPPKILRGSFSAVWTATIARKDAFCSIFRDLQSPLRAKKTCTHFFFARKKEHLARGALARQAGCRWALGRLVGATNA